MMVRLFSWLAAFVSAMILIAGISIFWLSRSDIDQARQQGARAVAKSAALSLAAQIEQLDAILDKMAEDPDVVAAILSDNKGVQGLVAGKLEKYLPGVMKIRLLPASVSAPDETNSPRMGYADLEMARQALASYPPPAVQGEQKDRHLAIARKIVYQNQAVGIVLASLHYEFIQKTLAAVAGDTVLLQLLQNKTMLAGSSSGANGVELAGESKLPIPGTNWTVAYQPKQELGGSDFLGIALMLLPLLLGLLAMFSGYRYLSELLTQDIHNVLKAFKDMMVGNLQGNYPFRLNELSALFSNLLQFKRVLDQQGHQGYQGRIDDIGAINLHIKEDNGLTDGINITVEEDDFDLDILFDDLDTNKPKSR